MHKSLSKKVELSGPLTDRTKAKSTDKQIKGFSYIRQIIIKTQEPDLPQITIYKVQRPQQNQPNMGLHRLQTIFQRSRLKKLFQGFNRISGLVQSSKMRLVNVNRLANLLKGRQRKLLNNAWLKLSSLKIRQKNNLNTSRLLSKISIILINKVKTIAFNKLKSFVFSKIKRSITETSESTVRKAQQNFQMQLTKLKSLQISEKFMIICRKIVKLSGKKFIDSVTTELEVQSAEQIERYKRQRNNQGLPLNNQIILLILNSQTLALKQIKNESQANAEIVKQFQKQDLVSKLKFYEQIEKQFQQSDKQIRILFEKYNRIEEKQLGKMIQGQLLKWNKLRQYPLYNSRLFISAIIAKMAKQYSKPLLDFFQKLQSFLKISGDIKKIEDFKKTLTNEEKGSLLLIQIANKFIDLNTFGMQPIMQKGFSQNEQIFMSEIRYIKQEIKDFIVKFNNPVEKPKLNKSFSTKRAKAPQQLKDLYATLNELIGLIKSLQSVKKETKPANIQEDNSKKEEIIKLLKNFNNCLKQGNYKKWQNYLKSIKKQEFEVVLALLDQINDILNEKIKVELQPTIIQLEKMKTQVQKMKLNEKKATEVTNNLKKGKEELEKTFKMLESQRNSEKNEEKQAEWEGKYLVLLKKYEKLQKQQQQLQYKNKNTGDERELSTMKKKLEGKDGEIEKLKLQIKSVRQKSIDKVKYEGDKKKIQQKYESDMKQLKMVNEAFKQEIQAKNSELQENSKAIQDLQSQIKRLSNNMKNVKPGQKIDEKQKIQIDNLNKKILDLSQKYEAASQMLQSRQSELQRLRTFLISQQAKISQFQTSLGDHEALIRKISVLTNNNESLKNELEQKIKRLQQYQGSRRLDQENQRIRMPTKGDKNIESSFELIKKLNEQLQKLKRSEITLEQINRELQNAHNRGQDVQAMISKIEIENNEYRKNLIQRDKIIFELKNQISRLNTQLALINPQLNSLTAELNDRELTIKRLEVMMKDREVMSSKQIENKRDYIRKLENIISVHEQAINDLNIQINKVRTKQPEIPASLRNQIQMMQNRIKELSNQNLKVPNLEKMLFELQNKYKMETFKWDDQKKKLENERALLQEQLRKLNSSSKANSVLELTLSEFEKKYSIQKTIWDDERRKWDEEIRRRQDEKQKREQQLSKALNSSRINANLEFSLLQLEKKYNNEKKIWEDEKRRWESERQRLDSELSKWVAQIQKWEKDKISWNNDRQKLEIEWKSFISKYEQATAENNRLITQLNQLNGIINELRNQVSLLTGSSINVDNIVWLLANITSNFIRIHPKPNAGENQKTFELIFRDLMSIKQQYLNIQQQMFMNLEKYIVNFVETDIGKYRFELMVKIEELSGLKQRLNQFLNNEIEISKKNMSYQYNFEIKEVSTAAKSLYETPMKALQTGFKIASQIREVKQKSINPQRLF